MSDKPLARSMLGDEITWEKLKSMATTRREKMSATLTRIISLEWDRNVATGGSAWPLMEPKKKSANRSLPRIP